MTEQSETTNTPSRRVAALDVARGIALVAMTTFHFSWDLEYFGYASPGLTAEFGFKWYARAIAFTFLLLVGASLYLAHGSGLRSPAFLRRLAQIVAAAAVISLVTWYVTPERFVFFGILHQIAAASVIALLFLRFQPIVTFLAAGFFLLLPHLFRSTAFETPLLWWTGLAVTLPVANDYVPVFPWTGIVLLGLAATKYLASSGLLQRGVIPGAPVGRPARLLAFFGRNSLAYYLIHQPLLFALIYAATLIAPPDRTVGFTQSCDKSCVANYSTAVCKSFCSCVVTTLKSKALFNDVLDGKRSVADDPQILEITNQCTASAFAG